MSIIEFFGAMKTFLIKKRNCVREHTCKHFVYNWLLAVSGLTFSTVQKIEEANIVMNIYGKHKCNFISCKEDGWAVLAATSLISIGPYEPN